MPLLAPSQVIRDTYVVERLLGEGAFAEVYRVKHRFMGRQALKLFKTAGASMAELERDLQEAATLSSLKHRNIVEVFDANTVRLGGAEYGYFTMTYVPGGSLDRHWRSFDEQMMPVEQAVELMRQACRGLAVAHLSSPPIIHRDIKPQNMLVGFDAAGLQLRLSDFGLAKEVNPISLIASAKGTMSFKPPEALDDIDSCAADIWAMGTTLYLLLTDRLPYPALGQRDIGDARRFLRPPRLPSVFNVRVDPALESIIFRCLAAERTDRYANAEDLLRDLEQWSPDTARMSHASASAPSSKAAIVAGSEHDLKAEARVALREALKAAQDATKLHSAADLLEEAISKDPALIDQYQSHLMLWRQGVMSVSTNDLARAPRKPSGEDA